MDVDQPQRSTPGVDELVRHARRRHHDLAGAHLDGAESAGISAVGALQNLLSVVSPVRVVGPLVDRDGDREDEALVLARGDLDPVGVAQRKPLLRYTGDRVTPAADIVLVVQDISLADPPLYCVHGARITPRGGRVSPAPGRAAASP
jgi:hypothetical protein